MNAHACNPPVLCLAVNCVLMANLFILAVIETKILIRGGFRAACAALMLQRGHVEVVDRRADSKISSQSADVSPVEHVNSVVCISFLFTQEQDVFGVFRLDLWTLGFS